MKPFAERMKKARAAAAKKRGNAASRKRRRTTENPELLTLLGNPIHMDGEGLEPMESFEMAKTAAAALRYAQERANIEQQVVRVWKDGTRYMLTVGARSRPEGWPANQRVPGHYLYATATPDAPPRKHSMRRVNPDRMTWHKAKVVGKQRRETAKQLRAAEKAYRRFHGVDPATVKKVPGRAPVLVALGQLKEVVYQPTRGARKGPAFFHVFGKGATLAATPDGKHLILVASPGKPFRVKWDRGIVG